MRIVKKNLLDETSMARFMTETILLRTLDHPNILRLNEMYQDPKRFFVVTELCHGGELFDTIENYVNTGKFCTESEAVYILSQMLSAVAYLHANEVIHMDLKPENVLFISKKDQNIKLIDFALAQATVGDQSLKILGRPLPSVGQPQALGTAYYIAPEVLTGKFDTSCDIWSLGCILYLMLTGVPPFPG